MEEKNTAQAKLSELKDSALKHYDEISAKAHIWQSFIPRAINHYRPLRKGIIFKYIYNLITYDY